MKPFFIVNGKDKVGQARVISSEDLNNNQKVEEFTKERKEEPPRQDG